MELAGRRQSGRPKRRFMDVERSDVQIVVVRQKGVEDRERLTRMNCCGNSENQSFDQSIN